MRDLFRKLRSNRFNYRSLVRVEIDRERLLRNYRLYQKIMEPVQVAPVLKSNAYGHGLVLVAELLAQANCPLMVVDSYHEVMILRNEGVKTPLLMIGQTYPENILTNRLRDVVFVMTNVSWLKEIVEKATQPVVIQLKFDTGMNRQGLELSEFEQARDLLSQNRNIVVEGICSHLADADGSGLYATRRQIEEWNGLVKRAKRVWPGLKYWHLGASSSLYYKTDIDANLMRLGLGLYGLPSDVKIGLNVEPVMAIKSVISSLRMVKIGEKVGYNGSFVAADRTKVATVPIGYFEGVDRRLSNRGFFRVRGVWCPIVGNVSMNLTTIDVTEVDGVKVGDEVEIIADERLAKNSVENIARLCDTLSYDVLVGVERMLRREMV